MNGFRIIKKSAGHKYIQRVPKKSGKGYTYIYPEDVAAARMKQQQGQSSGKPSVPEISKNELGKLAKEMLSKIHQRKKEMYAGQKEPFTKQEVGKMLATVDQFKKTDAYQNLHKLDQVKMDIGFIESVLKHDPVAKEKSPTPEKSPAPKKSSASEISKDELGKLVKEMRLKVLQRAEDMALRDKEPFSKQESAKMLASLEDAYQNKYGETLDTFDPILGNINHIRTMLKYQKVGGN